MNNREISFKKKYSNICMARLTACPEMMDDTNLAAGWMISLFSPQYKEEFISVNALIISRFDDAYFLSECSVFSGAQSSSVSITPRWQWGLSRSSLRSQVCPFLQPGCAHSVSAAFSKLHGCTSDPDNTKWSPFCDLMISLLVLSLRSFIIRLGFIVMIIYLLIFI